MTPLTNFLARLTKTPEGFSATITTDWHQGRTAFGGLSAALCVETALRGLEDLPPLRSAELAYIGPAAGEVSTSVSVLRRGRSTVFANVDLMSEGGLAMRALLCFGAARDSTLSYEAIPAPAVKAPADCPPAFQSSPTGRAPGFMQHFDARLAALQDPAAPKPERLLWIRHADEAARPGSVATLVALADAAPPPAILLFTQPGPISTMTWMIDVLTDAPVTEDGWWLVRSTAETARGGYSSQAMTLWNAAGEPIMAGRQSVAVFV